ncbi:murein transglycosylase A [Rhizobium sp. KVB221]|uniref:peptidoglycan lytic exotransglycosylase n=1 Tax=Rhizobium setariae TaxID=2801340 RepID=A0A936YV66_9HYPH|nr:murein transglycosylase A [Rhizobium setariae]MBL0374161.1 murein transglycosylase A [Rhizobium setariae]
MDYELKEVSFDALPGWRDEDPSSLFSPMGRCLWHMRNVKPYKTGSLGIASQALEAVFSQSVEATPASPAAARRFFEQYFQPFLIRRKDGASGFVTAFYEPEVEVSDTADDIWRYPFYLRPDDLVDLDVSNRPEALDATYAFGQQTESGVRPYPDRRAIDEGALAGRGLEIAWARSRVDVFFAHVQGAARLRFRDGALRRITYSAKAGHPFTGIGRHLADIGEIPLAQVSMASIRQWLADHPQRQDEILWQNRSYIFFREAPVEDIHLGPVAAAKVPLEAMRSIAVDRQIHTFSSLFYIDSPSLTHLTDGVPFQRLMMALDTGTAIVGPARGDLFTGSGDAAGVLAGNVKNDADFYILVPKSVAAEYR